MAGIIGKKVGMTSIFDENRKNIPCTVVVAGPCVVTQVRNLETDGYEAIQLGYDEKKEKRTPNAEKGHFAKAGTSPKKVVWESESKGALNLGDVIDVSLFQPGEFVDVSGTSKGKGFQGVVKRHGFHGVGGQTHGQHNRGRAPGSLGPGSTPSRVFKGMKMAGRMGGETVTVQNLRVLKVVPEKNLLVIAGPIPGPKNGYIFIEK
ncbi:UNVERIFIED_CONTAM: hypothetical protein GTU68_003504 [Idotea baltica]|nr:hypothetical protein [Idotea baltica]